MGISSGTLTSSGSSASLYRKMLASSAAYTLAIIAQRIASVIMLPVYTRALLPADYGTLDLVDQTMSILAILAGGQLAAGLFYFYANAESDEKREAVISTAMIGTLGFAVLVTFIGWVTSGPLSSAVLGIPQGSRYFRLAAIGMGLGFPLEVLFNWLRALNRPVTYVSASIARLGTTVVLALILLLGAKQGVQGVLAATVISSGITLLWLGWLYLRSAKSFRFDIGIFWELYRFSLPLIVIFVCLVALNSGDRFFLRKYTGLGQVGIYSVGYKIGMVVGYAQSAFQLFWSAQAYEILKRADANEVFAKTVTFLILTMASIGLAAVAAATILFSVVAGPNYQQALPLVPWIMAVYLAKAVADQLRTVFYTTKRPWMDTVVLIPSALICLVAYYFLIPKFASYGAIAATWLGFGSMALLAYFVGRRVHSLPLERRRLAMIGAAFAAALALLLLASGRGSLIQDAAAIASLSGFLLVIWKVVLTTEERLSLRKAVHSMRSGSGFQAAPGTDGLA
jgi:O-antigen/teichoic acid export membrane protein